MASVPVKRLGEVEHGLEISLCRYQVQFRYDTVSDILFRYVIGRGETGAFENGELRIENCFVWRVFPWLVAGPPRLGFGRC